MKKILFIIGFFLIAGNFLFAGGEQAPPPPPSFAPPPSAPPPSPPSEWSSVSIHEKLKTTPAAPVSPAPTKPTENTVREQQTRNLTLDEAIENSGRRIEETVPGSKLAVLNFTSSSEKFSDYVVEELNGVLAEGRKVTIVDRQNLMLIRKEMELQTSGDVSEKDAQAIGKQLGAQYIVSGSLTPLGNYFRFRVKVISVETAELKAQPTFNMQNDAQVAFLLGPSAPAAPVAAQPATPATVQPATPAVSQPQSQPAAPVQPVGQTQPGLYTGDAYIPTQPSASAPQPRISSDRAGLYVNGAYQGNMDLLDSIDWIKLNARSGGNYTIVLGKDEAVPYIMLNFNNLMLSITLKGSGAERRVRFDNNRPAYPLFTVGAGVTFILEDGITLTGLQSNSKSLVRVEGGNFTMNGGSITNTNIGLNTEGGGVFIESGAFTMNNGTINENSGDYGGGVFIKKGTFTMHNGTISGNSANGNVGYGGGVYVSSDGTFTMLGGTISGNFALDRGGGVYCSGTFTKSGIGGIIYGSNAPDGQANKARNNSHAVYTNSGSRNSTARISQALDSNKRGASGGWE